MTFFIGSLSARYVSHIWTLHCSLMTDLMNDYVFLHIPYVLPHNITQLLQQVSNFIKDVITMF